MTDSKQQPQGPLTWDRHVKNMARINLFVSVQTPLPCDNDGSSDE